MLDHADHAVILQHDPRCLEHVVGRIADVEPVHRAEDKHAIDRPGQFFGHFVDLESGYRIGLDTGHRRHIRLETFGPALRPHFLGAVLVGASVAVLIEGDIFARTLQIRREDPGVPAATRAVFGHGHSGRDLEELKRFRGVAVLIARAIIVAQIGRQNAGEIARMMVGGKRGRNEGGNGGSQHQAHGKRSPCN